MLAGIRMRLSAQQSACRFNQKSESTNREGLEIVRALTRIGDLKIFEAVLASFRRELDRLVRERKRVMAGW